MQITRTQIEDCLHGYVKNCIVDAGWHINLVEDFMHLLDGDVFDSDELRNQDYIKSVIDSPRFHHSTDCIYMRKTPEKYISALFDVVARQVNQKPKDAQKSKGMKCSQCGTEMIYKENIKLLPTKAFPSVLGITYKKKVKTWFGRFEEEEVHGEAIQPEFYVCPSCGALKAKVPDEQLDFVVNATCK